MVNYSLVAPGFRARRSGEKLKLAYALFECGHEYLDVLPLAFPTANSCPLHGPSCDLVLYLVSYSDAGDEQVRRMLVRNSDDGEDTPEMTKLMALVESLRPSAQDTLKALNNRGWDITKG
jgi:hypothetical protein